MILIGADFVPTKSNYELFCAGDAEALFGAELSSLLKQADYRIFNLETPLCDALSPISKNGKNLAAPSTCVNGYQAAGADLLTLANNHILDQGEQGLISTWRCLEQAGISWVGAGADAALAARPFLFTCKGKRVGVFACAEHEFSIAGASRMGANPYDALETPGFIQELKQRCDYVIVLYHGGKEYYRYPSPGLQKLCRGLVQSGADLVICQHSHCIGCEERFEGGVIVYGQGNFLFDISNLEAWQTSLLICVEDDFQIRYFPLRKEENRVRLADDSQAEEVLSGFRSRSREILREDFVRGRYEALAAESLNHYLYSVCGSRSLLFRLCNRLSGGHLKSLAARRVRSAQRLELLNYLECESIRELFIAGLKSSSSD